MRNYLDGADLGPWKNNSEEHHLFKQIIHEEVQMKKPKELTLPRMTKKYPEKINDKRKTKYNFDLPLKINPIKGDFNTQRKNINQDKKKQIKQARQSKTLSFDPPMISFYNKKHPRYSKTKGKKMQVNSFESEKKNHVSKIDLLCEGEQQKQEVQTVAKSAEYQFAKKRSLMEMLKYIRNPGLIQSPEKKNNQPTSKQFEEMSNLLSLGLTKRTEKLYIPSSRRVTNSIKKK